MSTLTKPLEKTVLNPETIPSVSIDFMNNTHFEEIALVQDIGDLITLYQESKLHTEEEVSSMLVIKITRLLHQWLDHTKAHFEHENELMKEYKFPAYGAHASEHEIAFENMQNIVKRWDNHLDIDTLSNYIFQSWPKWFSDHVNSMDMITAQYAVLHGFDPE